MPRPQAAPTPVLPPQIVRALRRRLLAWYRKHQRDLPWRSEEPDPYHVLVSEAMLQQTQVATVIPYFHRFLEAFPDIRALARAKEAEVLKLWQGLGYYRRARHLHAAAQAIVAEYGGEVPSHTEDLLALPGVGRYTAGAVASIAFGRRAPLVDGNVERVLARWFALEDDPGTTASKKRFWALAEALVPAGSPGDFNQGLMELGATVCTPKSPRCLYCPVSEHCEAHRLGRVDEIPPPRVRKTPQSVTHAVVLVERRGRYLVEQRPDDGLWSGMWQFVTSQQAVDLPGWVASRFGLQVEPLRRVDRFSHQTTHRSIQFEVYHTTTVTGRLRPNTARWATPHKIQDLPLSNPQQRVLRLVQAGLSHSVT